MTAGSRAGRRRSSTARCGSGSPAAVRSRTVTVTVTRLSPRGFVQQGGGTRRLKIGKPLAAGKRSKLVKVTIR